MDQLFNVSEGHATLSLNKDKTAEQRLQILETALLLVLLNQVKTLLASSDSSSTAAPASTPNAAPTTEAPAPTTMVAEEVAESTTVAPAPTTVATTEAPVSTTVAAEEKKTVVADPKKHWEDAVAKLKLQEQEDSKSTEAPAPTIVAAEEVAESTTVAPKTTDAPVSTTVAAEEVAESTTVAPAPVSNTATPNTTISGITIPEGQPLMRAGSAQGIFYAFPDRTFINEQDLSQSQIDEIKSRGVSL